MSMKELYNHFNNHVYYTINWYTDRKVRHTLGKTFDEIKNVSERPGPYRTTLRTFECKDFRFVETINTAAGDRGNIYHIPTGELIATDTVFYNFHTFVWWVYNHR